MAQPVCLGFRPRPPPPAPRPSGGFSVLVPKPRAEAPPSPSMLPSDGEGSVPQQAAQAAQRPPKYCLPAPLHGWPVKVLFSVGMLSCAASSYLCGNLWNASVELGLFLLALVTPFGVVESPQAPAAPSPPAPPRPQPGKLRQAFTFTKRVMTCWLPDSPKSCRFRVTFAFVALYSAHISFAGGDPINGAVLTGCSLYVLVFGAPTGGPQAPAAPSPPASRPPRQQPNMGMLRQACKATKRVVTSCVTGLYPITRKQGSVCAGT
ncbi:hypothetical protein ABPG77_007949 [Micractinium sp. CCAP 211/92]